MGAGAGGRVPARVAMAALAAALVLACGGRGTVVEDGLPPERRAALAFLTVANHTADPLTVSFRYAIEPGGEITLGVVASGEVRLLPPVPATEPIVLMARGGPTDRRLEPRSFDVDQSWTWVIEAADDR